MMTLGVIAGWMLWWALRLGNSFSAAWYVRRFASWFFLLITPLAGTVAAGQSNPGAGLVLGAVWWFALMLFVTAPSVLIFYFWKVRRS